MASTSAIPTTSSPSPIPNTSLPLNQGSSSHARGRSSFSESHSPTGQRVLKDLSPEPVQTFHKSHVKGPHLTGTHLFEGVTGAAHSTSISYDQNQAILQQRRHSSSMSGSNIAGQDHGIQLEGKRKQVLEDTLALFSSKPSLEIFQRSWREDATFEDPLSKCHSYPEYAAQWFGMPKLFPVSITKSYRVLSSTTNPNQITYHQEQEYTVRGIGSKKLMVSTVVIDLDDEDRIIHLSDKWNGKEHPSNFVAMALRRLNAKTLPWFVGVPKLKAQ